MTAEPDLLPCPFCGRQVFLHHGQNGIGFVTCGQRDDGSDGCGAITSFRPNKGGKTAITAWNRRATAARDAEVDALRAEVAEARDGWHMANGTAKLAMRHRDAAEAHAERLAEALREFLPLARWVANCAGHGINSGMRAKGEKLVAFIVALHPTAAREDDNAKR